LLVSGVLVGALATTTVVVATHRTIAGRPTSAASSLSGACAERTSSTVVTPAVLVPVLRAAARRRCIDLDLRPADGRAGALASRQPGVDVWITDSTLWALARGGVDPTSGVSVASSPVVMVASLGIADAVAGPAATGAGTAGPASVSWGLTLKRSMVPGLQIGIQDPASTAVGLLTGQAVFAAARAALPDEFTALSATAAGLRGPRLLDAANLGGIGPRELVFAAEYAASTATEARVLHGREGEPYLDFPAFVLTTDPARRATATNLITELASPNVAAERATARLRSADGAAGFPDADAPTGPRLPMVDQKTAVRLFGLAQSGSVPGRDLVTVDVSGSMSAQVRPGETLMDVVRRSGLVALTALGDQSSLGLWEFASRIDGERDYREIVPITPLSTGRAKATDAVMHLGVIPNGATGLYDTVLAAYQQLQNGYDPKAQQYLVVLTDGKNENDVGLDLDGLLNELHRIQDPARPISLIAIGYGHADTALLQRIADVMGGNVYAVSAPEQIVGVLIDAIGHAHTT
jgi:hypothetical protein